MTVTTALVTSVAGSAAMATVAGLMTTILIITLGRNLLPALRRGLGLCGTSLFGSASFNDLVEFATIQPDTPALWAIVNLDALAFAHHQIHTARGTEKPSTRIGGGCCNGTNGHLKFPFSQAADRLASFALPPI